MKKLLLSAMVVGMAMMGACGQNKKGDKYTDAKGAGRFLRSRRSVEMTEIPSLALGMTR